MKPTSKNTPTLEQVLAELEGKLKEIEGQDSNKSDNSTEQNSPQTPRLKQISKSKTTAPIFSESPAKYIEGTHTSPLSKRSLEKKIPLKDEKIQREKKSSSEEKSSSSTTPQSIRLSVPGIPTPLSSRSSVPSPTTTPLSTPTATPRDANANFSGDSSDSAQPRSPRTKELRKKISKSFSRAALNISKLGDKLSSSISTTTLPSPKSPKSSGRNSPQAHSSTRSSEKSTPFPEITTTIKNQAARALSVLESTIEFKNANATKKALILNAKLIEILTNNKINIDVPILKFLQAEAIERSHFSVIDTIIDIQVEPFVTSLADTMRYIKSVWGSEKGDRGDKYLNMIDSEKKEADLCFVPMFLRDEASGFAHFKIEQKDGSYKDISSLAELADFLNQDDPESIDVRKTGEVKNKDNVLTHSLRSKYISLFTCQFISNEIGNIGFAIDPMIPSAIKLYDGSPLSPSGTTTTTWSYSKTVDGGVKVKLLMERTSVSGKLSKLKNEEQTKIQIDDGAIATLETELYFSASRDLRIGDVKLHSRGWNLPAE